MSRWIAVVALTLLGMFGVAASPAWGSDEQSPAGLTPVDMGPLPAPLPRVLVEAKGR